MRWLALCLFAFSSVATSLAQYRYGTTYSNLDDQTALESGVGTQGWGSCTGPGCAGGLNSASNYSPSFTNPPMLVGWPSLDGSSQSLYMYARLPYSNVLWYYKLGLSSSATRFNFDLHFYIDQNAANNVQAFEFDTFQNYNNQQYTFGLQCNLLSKTWDVWNGATGGWVQTQLACNGFSPSKWHHLTLSYHRTSDLKMHYDSTSDGRGTKTASPAPG